MKRTSFLWIGLFACPAAALPAGDVIINEIHYDPPDETLREEFLELHNAGAESVDLSGWYLSEGVEFTFPDRTVIPAGGYLVPAQPSRTQNRQQKRGRVGRSRTRQAAIMPGEPQNPKEPHP